MLVVSEVCQKRTGSGEEGVQFGLDRAEIATDDLCLGIRFGWRRSAITDSGVGHGTKFNGPDTGAGPKVEYVFEVLHF